MSTPSLSTTPPLTGLAGLKQNWRSDLLSGFLVFLIALPLCLGIAMASGFPPMGGIITAIVGGVLVSRLNGSFVTINGPAAGLIVVVLGAVQSLGQGDAMAGYRYTLAAIVVASVFQTLMGLFKAGRLSAFFPSSVVHGMLAAIGIIIMAKQIHVMLGVKPEAKELIDTILAIPHSVVDLNPEIACIGFAGLALLIAWSLIKNRVLKMIPAPLVVVAVGILLERYFDLDHEHVYMFLPDQEFLPHHEFSIGPKFLVSIPDDFLAGFYFPDFGKIATVEFWSAVLSICLVGSVESLLSAAAVDKLDPYKRCSDLNRDLAAVGMGNVVCGLLGGLPMIAEIVRSSANVNNGAQTGWANFFHGLFLLIFVALFPHFIHEIPLASLAALLVYTGFRLASPKEFAKTMAIGWEQLTLFVVTIAGVLATDLLIGVAMGIAAKFALHLLRGVSLTNLFKLFYHVEQKDADHYVIKIEGAAVFSNFMALKSAAAELPQGKTVVFDLSDVYLIDHTVMEFIDHYCHDYNSRGGQCAIHGLHNHEPFSSHPLAARRRLDRKPAAA
ncbi:SulP family inorganic anion transporter [Methylogaea oryzae]|uniref:Sulfate transporter n=1 Tax=Methylogaea oryzae TaxID=1295382 RepID=A0A8D4VPT8_9GAMM|nr:SulP family inorganic anion transporter [Methylogaea oryzae]BBL71825.1 sulfate transporter [Methylogaea oryzae]